MKVSNNTPQWVTDLVTQICKEHKRRPPGELVTRIKTDKAFSSGTTYNTRNAKGKKLYVRNKTGKLVVYQGKITFSLGTNEIDARHVVLHEIAHWITNRNRGMGHNTKFYKLVFKLHEDYKANIKWAYCREGLYMKTSTKVFERDFAEAHDIKPIGRHAMYCVIHYQKSLLKVQ